MGTVTLVYGVVTFDVVLKEHVVVTIRAPPDTKSSGRLGTNKRLYSNLFLE